MLSKHTFKKNAFGIMLSLSSQDGPRISQDAKKEAPSMPNDDMFARKDANSHNYVQLTETNPKYGAWCFDRMGCL